MPVAGRCLQCSSTMIYRRTYDALRISRARVCTLQRTHARSTPNICISNQRMRTIFWTVEKKYKILLHTFCEMLFISYAMWHCEHRFWILEYIKIRILHTLCWSQYYEAVTVYLYTETVYNTTCVRKLIHLSELFMFAQIWCIFGNSHNLTCTMLVRTSLYVKKG